jgi:hypothetical protein
MLRHIYCMLRQLYWFSMKLMASLAQAQAEDEAGVVPKAVHYSLLVNQCSNQQQLPFS